MSDIQTLKASQPNLGNVAVCNTKLTFLEVLNLAGFIRAYTKSLVIEKIKYDFFKT